MPVDRSGARGFSLAEALVAMAIGAGVMVAYFNAISTSMDLERRARARGEAALIVEGLLDQIGFEMPLDQPVAAGRDPRGYVWQVRISEGVSLLPPPGAQPPSTTNLRQVDIEVQGPELPGGYRLVTLRMAGGTLK